MSDVTKEVTKVQNTLNAPGRGGSGGEVEFCSPSEVSLFGSFVEFGSRFILLIPLSTSSLFSWAGRANKMKYKLN